VQTSRYEFFAKKYQIIAAPEQLGHCRAPTDPALVVQAELFSHDSIAQAR
jgi:hypothetical protein